MLFWLWNGWWCEGSGESLRRMLLFFPGGASSFESGHLVSNRLWSEVEWNWSGCFKWIPLKKGLTQQYKATNLLGTFANIGESICAIRAWTDKRFERGSEWKLVSCWTICAHFYCAQRTFRIFFTIVTDWFGHGVCLIKCYWAPVPFAKNKCLTNIRVFLLGTTIWVSQQGTQCKQVPFLPWLDRHFDWKWSNNLEIWLVWSCKWKMGQALALALSIFVFRATVMISWKRDLCWRQSYMWSSSSYRNLFREIKTLFPLIKAVTIKSMLCLTITISSSSSWLCRVQFLSLSELRGTWFESGEA